MSEITNSLDDVTSEDLDDAGTEQEKSAATPEASTKTSVDNEISFNQSRPEESRSSYNEETNRESPDANLPSLDVDAENKDEMSATKTESKRDENSFNEYVSDLDNSKNSHEDNVKSASRKASSALEINKISPSNISKTATNKNSIPKLEIPLSSKQNTPTKDEQSVTDNDEKMSSIIGSDQMSMIRKMSFKRSSLTKHSPMKISSVSPQMRGTSSSTRLSDRNPSVAKEGSDGSVTDRTEMTGFSTATDIKVRPSSDITTPIKTAHIKDHRLSTNMWNILSTENASSRATPPDSQSALNNEGEEATVKLPKESFDMCAETGNQTIQEISESETNRSYDSQISDFESLRQSQQSTPKTRFPGQRFKAIRDESVLESTIPEEDESGEYLYLEEETQRSTAASPKWVLLPPGARLAQNLPPSDFFISKKNEIISNQCRQEQEKKRTRDLRKQQKIKHDSNVERNRQVQKRREKRMNSRQRRVMSTNERVLQRFNEIEMRTRERECARSRRKYEEAQRRIEEQRRQVMEERQRRIEENALMLWILDLDVKI